MRPADRLALTIDDGGRDVWLLDLERGGRTKVTFGQASEFAPIWTPDGSELIYAVARDTKLDRDVALKVLPEAFTSDPDRLARFERELRHCVGR